MNKKTKIIIPSAAVFLIVAALVAGLYTNTIAITQEPPYLWVTATTSGTPPGKVLPVAIYAVAFVYPNGSFILEAWVYNPNPFTFIAGVQAYPMAHIPVIGNTWAAYDGVSGVFHQKNIGEIYPFSFSYANAWSGVTYNFTNPDYTGRTVEVQTLLQTAPYNLFHYNGTGQNQIWVSYGFINGWGNATWENFTFLGVGPEQTITIVQNTVLPYQTVVIPANSTHVWVAVPNWPVYPQEIPPNFPYAYLVKTTSAPLPSWWGSKAIQ